LSAHDLSKYVGSLESRRRAEDAFLTALSEMKVSKTPIIVFITAEWGEGKTSLFFIYLDKLRPPDAVSFIVNTRTFIRYLEQALDKKLFPHTNSAAYQVLASILAALVEEQSSAVAEKCGCKDIELPKPFGYNDAKTYINDVLNRLLNEVCKARMLILFIDEFEDIVSINRGEVLETTITGLTHIMNGAVEEISREGKPFCGRLHLVISLTPAAYAKIQTFRDMATTIARLERRIKRIELRPLTRSETYEFIRGVLRYMYEKNDLRISDVFNPPNTVNPIAIATLGNMSAIQRAITEIVFQNAVKNRCNENEMMAITPNTALDLIRNVRVNIAGASLPIVVEHIVDRIINLWSEYAQGNLVDLPKVLLSTILIGRSTLSNLLKVEENQIDRAINRLYAVCSSRTLGIGARRFVYSVRTIDISLREKIVDIIKSGFELVPRLRGSAQEIAETIVENSTFIDENERKVIALPFDANQLRDFLWDSIPMVLGSDELEAITLEILSSLQDVEAYDGYYMLSPRAISTIYLSPELTFLSFIKDFDRRFRYWRELLSSVDVDHLLLGVVALFLSDRSRIEVRDVVVGG